LADSCPTAVDLLGRRQEAGAREAGEEEGEEVRYFAEPGVAEHRRLCWKCDSADLMERDDELGFQGNVVTVYDQREAVYDPVTGDILDEGAA
jgi:hypothetical protein